MHSKVFESEKPNIKNYISFTLANNGMPTLMKIKPASLIHFQRKYISEIDRFYVCFREELNKFACSYEVIYSDIRSLYIFIYQESQLSVLLGNYSKHSILLDNGYDTAVISLQMTFEVFKERYEKHMLYKAEFPHELGLFLGYPLLDVEGFILNNGQNYLINGYWKVYYNVENALDVFNIYTGLRNDAEKLFMQGRELTEIGLLS